MQIFNLTENSKIYTSNAYLILGEWNTLDDTNTLVDVGADPLAIEQLMRINTGLGKKKIDQVIITHSHSDHIAILPEIIKQFKPVVYAFNAHVKGVHHVLKDGDFIRIGELDFEVYHISAHSYDSICLYNSKSGILFAGDNNFPLEFKDKDKIHENAYPINRLKSKVIQKIYYGHGPVQDCTIRPCHIVK